MSSHKIQEIDLEELTYLNKQTSIGKGQILEIFDAVYSDEENMVTSYGYNYVFFSSSGDLNWTSYSNQRLHNVGDTVQIEYSLIRPSVNRIKWMSNTTDDGYSVIVFFLFATIGSLIWLIVFILKGIRKVKTITHGIITEGVLTQKKETSTKINENSVYKMVFTFTANDNKVYQVVVKTHKTSKLEDENSEKIIYHAEDPHQALVVDSLPWTVPKYIKKEWC
jgi:hypothetical protein